MTHTPQQNPRLTLVMDGKQKLISADKRRANILKILLNSEGNVSVK